MNYEKGYMKTYICEETGLPAGCIPSLVIVTFNITVIDLLSNNKYIFNTFDFYFLADTSPFCGANDTRVLNFW